MKETEFKVLMYCGNYVDANLLSKGIYVSSLPFIYSKHETIETIVERSLMIKEILNIPDKYFENLKLCRKQLLPF